MLISRINALLRRAKDFETADTEISSNDIKIFLQGQAYQQGQLLNLTIAEYKLITHRYGNWGENWQQPLVVLTVIIIVALFTTIIAVISPAKKMVKMSIVNVVNGG